MREGAEYFADLASAAQRRYEALRAYFLDGMPAAEVAAPVRVLHRQRPPDGHAAAQGPAEPVRRGQARPEGAAQGHRRCAPGCWSCGRPGTASPRSPPRSPVRECPYRRKPCWQILDTEGLPRLPRRDEGRRGRLEPVEPVAAAALPGPPPRRYPCPATMPGCCSCCRPAARRACRTWSPSPLPLHQGAVGMAVDRDPAAGQVRPHPPRLARRDAGR